MRIKAITGLAYGVFGRVFLTLLQLIASLATARFLTPREFGIVAFALVYINFLSQFSDIGISSAVVQKGRPSRRTLHIAFTLKAVIGLLLTITGFGIASILALMGQAPSGVVLAILSLTFFVSTISFIPNTRLTLELNYPSLFHVSVASAVCSTLVTLSLLLSGFGFWAVPAAYIASVFWAAAHLNYIRPSFPRILWDKRTSLTLLSFGLPLFITGLVNFAVIWGGNLVVGTFLGPAALGLYALALTFSFMLVNQVGSVIVSVLFPVYSKIRAEGGELRIIFLKSVEYTALFSILINVGLISVSEQLFLLLSGDSEKWLPALATFRILCFGGILAALLFPIAPLTVAIGRPNLQLRAVGFSAAVQIICVFPAMRLFGIEGVAWVATIAWVAQYFVYLPILRAEFGVSLSTLARAVAPSIAAGMAMFAVNMAWEIGVVHSAKGGGSVVTLLAQSIALGLLFFAIHSALTKGRVLAELLQALRSAVAPRVLK